MSPEYKWFVQADLKNNQQAERVKEAISLLRGVIRVSEVNSEVDTATQPQIMDAVLTLPGLAFDITTDILADQAYLKPILEAVLVEPYRNTEQTILATRAYNTILRGVNWDWVDVDDRTGPMKIVFRKSLAEILQMSDEALLLFRNMGPKSFALFKHATQPLRNRFIEKQTSA